MKVPTLDQTGKLDRLPNFDDSLVTEGGFVIVRASDLEELERRYLTLIRTVESLLEAIDGIAVYPEGSFGFEDLAEAEKAARDVLRDV